MGKHRGKKKNWQTIEIDFVLDIGSAGIAIAGIDANGIITGPDDNFIATSLEATYTLNVEQSAQPTAVSNLVFGLSKSDYSITEIKEWVENTVGFARANLIAQEISRRVIKHVGVFQPRMVAAAEAVEAKINDGMPVKTRLNWRILAGQTITFWIYNGGELAVPTAANQKVRVNGRLAGFWED